MPIKTTLKHWIATLDEALLQDLGPDDPTPVPGLEAEDTSVQEPATAFPQDHTQPLASKRSLSLDTQVDIAALFSPTSVQIASPHAMDAQLLQPFETGAKAVLLLFPSNRKIIPATLQAIRPAYLLVDTPHSTVFHRPGEHALVIFPALPQKRYVLQTTIDAVYVGRFKMRYQGPRYDVRRQFRLAAPVLLRVLPLAVVTAIEQRQTRLVREIGMAAAASPPTPGGRLLDHLYERNAAVVSPAMQLLANAPALLCDLWDISVGGVCLFLRGGQRSEELLHRLVWLRIALPYAAADHTDAAYLPATLEPLGIVRGVRATAQACTLHLRFLKRLPEEYAALLASLEQRFVEQQSPLA
jgi:hypothetical protein